MADVQIQMKLGESEPIFGSQTATAGSTLTLTSSFWDLCDASGLPLPGMGNMVTAGSDVGALTTVRAWIVFNPQALALATGTYFVVVTTIAAGSDGISRTKKASCQVDVLSEIGAAADGTSATTVATFLNASTIGGQVRQHLRDTNPDALKYTDYQIAGWLSQAGYTGSATDTFQFTTIANQYSLALTNSIIYNAVAFGYDDAASDFAYKAAMKQISIITINNMPVYTALLERSCHYKELAAAELSQNRPFWQSEFQPQHDDPFTPGSGRYDGMRHW